MDKLIKSSSQLVKSSNKYGIGRLSFCSNSSCNSGGDNSSNSGEVINSNSNSNNNSNGHGLISNIGSSNIGSSNIGSSNIGSSNSGSSNSGSSNSGSGYSGSGNNGSGYNGSSNNGSSYNGSLQNGSNGNLHNGSSYNGSLQNGSSYNSGHNKEYTIKSNTDIDILMKIKNDLLIEQDIKELQNLLGYLQSMDILIPKSESKELEVINAKFLKYGQTSEKYKQFFQSHLDILINLNLEANNLDIASAYFSVYKYKHEFDMEYRIMTEKIRSNLPVDSKAADTLEKIHGHKLNCLKETFHAILFKYLDNGQFEKAISFFKENLCLANDYIQSNLFFQFLKRIYDNNQDDLNHIIFQTQNGLLKPRFTLPIIIRFYLKVNQLDMALKFFHDFKKLKIKFDPYSVLVFYSFIENYHANNHLGEAIKLFYSTKDQLAKEATEEKNVKKNIFRKQRFFRFPIYQSLFELACKNNQITLLDKLVKEMMDNSYMEIPCILFYNHLEYCKYNNLKNQDSLLSLYFKDYSNVSYNSNNSNNSSNINNSNNNNNDNNSNNNISDNSDNSNNNNNNDDNSNNNIYEIILSSFLKNMVLLKDYQKILILDKVVDLFVSSSSYEKAIFWYSYFLTKLNALISPTTVQRIANSMGCNTFNEYRAKQYWSGHFQDLVQFVPESRVFLENNGPEVIYYLAKEFLEPDKDNINMQHHEDLANFQPTTTSTLKNSLGFAIENSMLDKKDLILEEMVENCSVEEIIMYMEPKYFRNGLIPPKFHQFIRRIKNHHNYTTFLKAAPDYIKVLSFNPTFYKHFKANINTFIDIMSLENQSLVIKSTELLNTLLCRLIKDDILDQSLKLSQVLILYGYKVVDLDHLFSKLFNQLKAGKMEYPQELFDNLLLKHYKPSRIEALHIYCCYMFHLIQENKFEVAFEVFLSIKNKNQLAFNLGCEIMAGLYPTAKSNEIFKLIERWDRLLDIKKKNDFNAYKYYEHLFRVLANNSLTNIIEMIYQKDPTVLESINMDTMEIILNQIPLNQHDRFVELFFRLKRFAVYPQNILDRLQFILSNHLAVNSEQSIKLKEFFDQYSPNIDLKQVHHTVLTNSNKLYLEKLIGRLDYGYKMIPLFKTSPEEDEDEISSDTLLTQPTLESTQTSLQ